MKNFKSLFRVVLLATVATATVSAMDPAAKDRMEQEFLNFELATLVQKRVTNSLSEEERARLTLLETMPVLPAVPPVRPGFFARVRGMHRRNVEKTKAAALKVRNVYRNVVATKDAAVTGACNFGRGVIAVKNAAVEMAQRARESKFFWPGVVGVTALTLYCMYYLSNSSRCISPDQSWNSTSTTLNRNGVPTSINYSHYYVQNASDVYLVCQKPITGCQSSWEQSLLNVLGLFKNAQCEEACEVVGKNFTDALAVYRACLNSTQEWAKTFWPF